MRPGGDWPCSPEIVAHRPSYKLTTTASTPYAPRKHSRPCACWRFCPGALLDGGWRRGLSWSWATVGRTKVQAIKCQVDGGLGALLAPQAASSLAAALCWVLVRAGAGAATALWCFVPRGCCKRWCVAFTALTGTHSSPQNTTQPARCDSNAPQASLIVYCTAVSFVA